jgi:hypothetical protein
MSNSSPKHNDSDNDNSVDEYGVMEGISIDFMNVNVEPQRSYDIQNPNLFVETYAMSMASSAIFSLAKVREAAKSGIIDAPEVISLPMRVVDALRAFSINKHALKKVMKPADVTFLSTLQGQVERNEAVDAFFMQSVVENAVVHFFGDDDPKSECVHLLLENPQMKRILLCFRGSITMNDWLKDSKVMVGYIKNPLFMRPNQPAEIGVHLGFREYLYDERREISLKLPPVRAKINLLKKNVRTIPQKVKKILPCHGEDNEDDAGENLSTLVVEQSAALAPDDGLLEKEDGNEKASPKRVDEIAKTSSGKTIGNSRIARILEEVDSIRSKREDFRIYVTGHSLGGALAQLTALEIAAHWGTSDNPVTYIGIGNPRAATYSFRDVIETLEREGKLRCLGVHNHLDIVPMIPTSALHIQTKNTFCQVGFQLLMHTDEFEMRYCPKQNNGWQDLKQQTERMTLAIFRPDKIANRHHYLTYLTYLRDLQGPLSKLYLNDYYNAVVQPNLFPGSTRKEILAPANVTNTKKRDSVFNRHQVFLSQVNDGNNAIIDGNRS